MENVSSNEAGLEALIFTAEGDMRQALNNAQATHAGFGFINSENVFKVKLPPCLVVPTDLQVCAGASSLVL